MIVTTLAKTLVCRTRVGPALRKIPGVEHALERYTLTRKHQEGLFTGVFSSYEAAQEHIPQMYKAGWNNKESSRLWLHQYDMIQPTAYSTFFWIQEILKENDTLVDYGGSIGLSYYGYTERTALPKGVTWNVVEVPSVVETGRELASKNHAPSLIFFDDLRKAPASTLLFSAGALQYIRDGVPGLMEKLSPLPKHIIINKVPLIAKTSSFWTIQNFGSSISPYRIYNRSEFLEYFKKFGYRQVDTWEVPDLSCDIPFYPRRTISRLTGLYLRHG